MRKRPPILQDEPLDIFDDERFASALAGATRPTALPSAHSPPPSRAPSLRTASRKGGARAPPGATPGLRGRAPPRPPDALPLSEPNVPLKFRVPQSVRSDFHRFKAELAAALGGVALDDSNLARPLVEIFLVEQSDGSSKRRPPFAARSNDLRTETPSAWRSSNHAIGNIFRRAHRRRSPGTSSKSPTS